MPRTKRQCLRCHQICGLGLGFLVRDWRFLSVAFCPEISLGIQAIICLELNTKSWLRLLYLVYKLDPVARFKSELSLGSCLTWAKKLWSVWQAGQLLCRLPTYMKLVPWHWVLRSGAERGEKSLPHSDWWRLLAVWPVSGHFSCVYVIWLTYMSGVRG